MASDATRTTHLGDPALADRVVVRPDSSAARVGEHSAVVWKRVYFTPPAASRSRPAY